MLHTLHPSLAQPSPFSLKPPCPPLRIDVKHHPCGYAQLKAPGSAPQKDRKRAIRRQMAERMALLLFPDVGACFLRIVIIRAEGILFSAATAAKLGRATGAVGLVILLHTTVIKIHFHYLCLGLDISFHCFSPLNCFTSTILSYRCGCIIPCRGGSPSCLAYYNKVYCQHCSCPQW